ncbi:hybrid sensor histidine kinase/response regulator [Candidatus Halobeggiatoa sp. HSG11]|nr:hybrid sensor histidine kinase/response regulator [Candidatus Halobeggiatoa sp. HSG11]
MNNILVVDDTAANLRVLSQILLENDYKVRPAISGEIALKLIKSINIDLILLDIQMPKMNGYEVCKNLQADTETQNIPIIFVSALDDISDKIKAFEAGGVDYITKPYQAEEILVRVRMHLSLNDMQKQLQQKNLELEQEIIRCNKIEQALLKSNQDKDEFLGIAAHDLKNPLSAIKGYSEEIEEYCHEMPTEEVMELAGLIRKSSAKMSTLVTNLLDVNQIESGEIKLKFAYVDILPIVKNIVQDYAKRAKEKNINLHFSPEGNDFHAYVDANTVGQILDNIISNAVKYSPLDKDIYINLTTNENEIQCKIKNEGQGLNADDLKKLFGKFNRLSTKPTGGEHSTGLGLFIVKKLVEAMNAKICCESELGNGVIFIVEFKRK